GSVDQQIGIYFRFGINNDNIYNQTVGTLVNVGNLLRIPQHANPFTEDGTETRTVRTAGIDYPWVYSRESVETLQDQWLSETRAFASFNSLYGEVSIRWVEGLKYHIKDGLDNLQSNGGAYTGEGGTSTNPTTISSASISNQHTYHWLVENLLT